MWYCHDLSFTVFHSDYQCARYDIWGKWWNIVKGDDRLWHTMPSIDANMSPEIMTPSLITFFECFYEKFSERLTQENHCWWQMCWIIVITFGILRSLLTPTCHQRLWHPQRLPFGNLSYIGFLFLFQILLIFKSHWFLRFSGRRCRCGDFALSWFDALLELGHSSHVISSRDNIWWWGWFI